MGSRPFEWDVEGPVQAEVLVVWLRDDRLELTGPCASEPWILELGPDDHPLEVVDRVVRDVIGAPLLVHSTSWRRDRGAVILTFVVVVGPETVAGLDSRRIGRTELARSEATAAPRAIDRDQVLEHALRHLAWLSADDPVVGDVLSPAFRRALEAYVPAPFQALG